MKGQGRGGIVDAVSIRERPAEADDRAVPGHWEGDLLAGSVNSHIATLVERQTRYLLLVKVPGKDSARVVDALAAQVRTLPRQLWASLTWDRGVELAAHRRFSIATDVAVYFCDPAAPGSGAPTRTPTGCCASTSRSGPTSRSTARPTSTPWRLASTPGPARRWSTRRRRLCWPQSLRRPLELTGPLGRSTWAWPTS